MGDRAVSAVPVPTVAAIRPERHAAQEAFCKPYKGPESYQVEDSGLFHGRDAEAEQLIARILSSRFTLLHAQSGAGKTSLLNARIHPGPRVARVVSAAHTTPQRSTQRYARRNSAVPAPAAGRGGDGDPARV